MFEPFSLDQLTVFVTIVEEGSFSSAGRRLMRVQSAVSHAVASLEDSLGTQLFLREGRRPKLTPAGRRLAAEARLVLAQARELTACAAALREGLESELWVVVDPITPTARLAEVCAAFHRQFPTVHLRVETDLLGDAVAQVTDGSAALGVVNLGDAQDELLSAVAIGTVDMVPVCAPTHPLAQEPPPQRADRLRRWVQVVLTERKPGPVDHGVIASRTWRVTDLGVKVDLLRAGVGWGNVPIDLVAADLAAGRLVRLSPEPWNEGTQRVTLHAVVRADRPLGPAGTWLRERLALDAASPLSASPRGGARADRSPAPSAPPTPRDPPG